MYKVDLNSDLGESFGNYKLGCDEDVTKFVSSVNVACGFHARAFALREQTRWAARGPTRSAHSPESRARRARIRGSRARFG